MRMPRRASASGIPTAHPMMRPRLELEPPPDDELGPLLEAPGVGVTYMVTGMLLTPADPEDRLIDTEGTGVGLPDVLDDTASALPEDASADDDGLGVREGWLPPPDPVARPVMDERVGTVDAWFLPTVAYALPS